MKQSNGGSSFTCFLIGDGTLLQECGEILRKKSHRILGVVVAHGPQRKWAQQAGLEVIDPASNYGTFLRAKAFDYLFSINYLKKIPEAILKLAAQCAINFHDGPLPRLSFPVRSPGATASEDEGAGWCAARSTMPVSPLERLSSPEPPQCTYIGAGCRPPGTLHRARSGRC